MSPSEARPSLSFAHENALFRLCQQGKRAPPQAPSGIELLEEKGSEDRDGNEQQSGYRRIDSQDRER
jgi:hypothetical protein